MSLTSERPTIAIHAASASAIYQFCLALIKDFTAQRYRVITLAKRDNFAPLLKDKRIVSYHTYSGGRSVGLFSVARYLYGAYNILRKERPRAIHIMSPKAIFFITGMARSMGIKPICVFTGLGYVFTLPRYHPARMAAVVGFRLVLCAASRVVFLNRDDMAYFIEHRIVHKAKSRLIRSSGVNLQKYARATVHYPKIPTFIFLGRLMLIKGIARFLDAACAICSSGHEARFIVVGSNAGGGDELISDVQLAWYQRTLGTALVYAGHTHDVRAHLRKSSVLVLPTRYREGVPQSILEAMACKLAIITTDVPGCRETVIDGKNGFLVAPNEPAVLVKRMQYFIAHPEQVAAMGEESYTLAREHFSTERVNAETIALYREIGVGTEQEHARIT